MNPLWLDDLAVGDRFRTDEYEITQEEILAFAGRYDPQPFHLDEEAAAGSFFQGLAASGWHTAAVTMRLIVTSGLPIATGIIGAGVELSWPSPTRPGDVVHAEITVTEITPSRSKPDRGFVTIGYETVTRTGEIRQRTTATLLMFTRPSRPSPSDAPRS
ncbi:MaoC family dehydratase [Kocuria dechangensis]|uniref:MaoC family dehydratase n=1 Tax=Kocuria dechangensis TaxID=1176249 RepID=A0A917GYT4_9MICC|nr:MaoC family dehydratase [Kocuria dechangensis]GGG62173.1 MaoC family dehydratase [Kocuria dechangensis]